MSLQKPVDFSNFSMLTCIVRISYRGGEVGGWEGQWAAHAQEVVDSEKTVYKYHATV